MSSSDIVGCPEKTLDLRVGGQTVFGEDTDNLRDIEAGVRRAPLERGEAMRPICPSRHGTSVTFWFYRGR